MTESSEFPSFDQQLEFSKQNFAIFGTTVEVVRAKPSHPKSKTPVILNPSWGTDVHANKPALKKLHEAGREVISFGHIRDGRENIDPFERQTQTLQEVMERAHLPRSDIFTHSSGFISTVRAAIRNPEQFRTIVVYAPIGVDKDNIGTDKDNDDFVQRFIQSGTEEVMKGATETKQKLREVVDIRSGEMNYTRKNVTRSMNEIAVMSQVELSDNLRELRKKGVGIIVLLGDEDKGIRMGNVQKTLMPDMVDGVLTVKGTHDSHLIHPEQIMPLVDSVLTARETGKSMFS